MPGWCRRKLSENTFTSDGWAQAGGGTGAAWTYQHTPAHQLTNQSANHPSFQFEPPQTESVAYAVNSLNQYTTVTKDGLPSPITYDPNGNLTNDGANTFGYDAENKLLTATMGAGTNVAYEYDPTGRRASKTVDGTVTAFVYDADHLIAEYGGSGNVLRRYIHGPGTDRPIAMVDASGARSYYHADRLGSVIALTDDSGAESARYTYDAYGVPYLVDPGTGALTQVAAGQPYLFTGRRFDFETGLYYYRARYYSAALGRFLQTDPIGTQDQMNLYAYVANDPVNAADPSGLGSCPDAGVLPGASTVKCEDGPAAGESGRTPKTEKQKLNERDIPPLSDEDAKTLTAATRESHRMRRNPGDEAGAQLVKDRKTGEKYTVTGKDAGRPIDRGRRFRFSLVKGAKRLGLGHTHLSTRTGDHLRDSSGRSGQNAPGTDDQVALEQARVPIITVGPDVTTQLYRLNGQQYVRVIEGDASKIPDLSSQGILRCGIDVVC